MQIYSLNYDLVYFGRGMQIARMMIAYFDPDIKYLNKEPIFLINPAESDVVGIKLKFQIYNDFKVYIDILDDMNFEIVPKEGNIVYKSNIKNCDLWSIAKAVEFKYDIRDEAVKERIKLLDKASKIYRLVKISKLLI